MKKERESLLHTHSRVSIEERREGAKKSCQAAFLPIGAGGGKKTKRRSGFANSRVDPAVDGPSWIFSPLRFN